MATCESFDREPGAAQRTVRIERIERVLRAARMKTTARTEPRTDDDLIGANHRAQRRHDLTDHLGKQRGEARTDTGRFGAAHTRPRADHEVGGRQPVLGQAERIANYATKTVTSDGISDGTGGDREPEAWAAVSVRTYGHAEQRVAVTATLLIGRIEVDLAPQTPLGGKPQRRTGVGDQGISFLRPLARRRARILRPFAVAMRARKPCVRARRTLLG